MTRTVPPRRTTSGRAQPKRAARPTTTGDFVFEHDGREYTLPSFTAIKSGIIRRVRHMTDADAFYTVLEEVADEDTLAAVDDMTGLEVGELISDWQTHAGVSLGESSRSSSSSTGTARRSRTTGGTGSG